MGGWGWGGGWGGGGGGGGGEGGGGGGVGVRIGVRVGVQEEGAHHVPVHVEHRHPHGKVVLARVAPHLVVRQH